MQSDCAVIAPVFLPYVQTQNVDATCKGRSVHVVSSLIVCVTADEGSEVLMC